MDLDLAAERYLGRRRVPGEDWLFAKNAHPPAAVFLTLPFATFSYPNGMLGWNLLSLAALALTLSILARGLAVHTKPWMLLPLVIAALLCNPFRQQVNHGQLNLVLLLLLVGAWSSERSSRLRTAGFLVGVATAIKLFPAFLFLYFALRRRWTAVSSGVAAFAGITLLSAWIFGVDAYRTYFEEVMPTVSGFRHVWVNASLSGFWAKWFDLGAINPMAVKGVAHIPPLAALPTFAAVGLWLSAVAILSAWARAVWRSRSDNTFGLTLTTMLLLSPVTWDHYFLLLLLPVLQLWRTFPEPRWERIALIVVLVPLCLSPLLFVHAFVGTNTFLQLVGASIQFFGLTGLFLLGLRPAPARNTETA